MTAREIHPATAAPDRSFRAPASKSATHRALVAGSLATGRSLLIDPLDSDDTRRTLAGLQSMGVRCGAGSGGWWIEGRGGKGFSGGGRVDLGESGTTMRFLTALACLGSGPVIFTGMGRLPARPLEELLGVLEGWGVPVGRPAVGGTLPLEIGPAPGPIPGGTVRIDSGRSSQFASALLLIGSRMQNGLDLQLTGDPVSVSYVAMTASILSRFGVPVERSGELSWKVRRADYPGASYEVEGDWSSCSYLLAAASLTGGTVRVVGLDPDSCQPDAAILTVLQETGAEVRRSGDRVEVTGGGPIRGFSVDVSGCPDLAPTLAVLGLFSRDRCELRSAGVLRHKESDRLSLLAENLNRIGRAAVIREDDLVLPDGPAGPLHGSVIRTGSDHRIAMAFAVAGLRIPGVVIDDPDCVGKSNPGFWDQLQRLERSS